MSINLTLFGQMITFAFFVFFTMKFVWPHITQAMSERQKKMANGLAAAEQGKRDLELAQRKAVEIIREAKQKAADIIEHSNKRALEVSDDAKCLAKEEGQRLLNRARTDIEQELNNARRDLQLHVSDLAVLMAEKIIGRTIDPASHRDLLDQIATEV